MREGWYDACVVMMRRLVEIVIIEAYEHHSIQDRVKDGSGNYFQLSALIDAALGETAFNLGRHTKAALPKLRNVGHRPPTDGTSPLNEVTWKTLRTEFGLLSRSSSTKLV
jgi:hypothetical protein